MSKGHNLGEFEYLVLLALLRLGDEAYGMTVRRELADTAERDAGIGSVYQTLERLERKNLVESSVGDSMARQAGRPRRFYQVTEEGKQAVLLTREAFSRMWEGLKISKVSEESA